MADIEFNCPHCGGELVVDEVAAGMEVSCPHCDGMVRIPEADAGDEDGEGEVGVEVAAVSAEGVGEQMPWEEAMGEREEAMVEGGDSEEEAGASVAEAVEEVVDLPDEGGRGTGRQLDEGKLSRAVKAGAMQRTGPGELFVDFGKFARKGMLAFLCPACAVPVWIKRSQEGEGLKCGSCGSEILAPDSGSGRMAEVVAYAGGEGTRIESLPPRRERPAPKAAEEEQEQEQEEGGGEEAAAVSETGEAKGKGGAERVGGGDGDDAGAETAGDGESERGAKRIWVGPSRELQFTSLEDLESKREVRDGWEDDDRGAGGDDGETEKLSQGAQRVGILIFAGVVIALGYFVFSGGFGEEEKVEADDGVLDTEEEIMGDIINNFDQLEKVLDGFFAAQSEEEMARYVRNSDRTLPLMRDYYAENPMEQREYELLGGVNFERDGVTGKIFYFLDVRLDDIDSRGMVVERTESSYKIDWDSFVGNSEMPWATFLEARPTFPLLFRVKVSPDNYYNYQFSDTEKYKCYKLTDLDGTDFCFGYVERGSAGEKRLDARLAIGREMGAAESYFILQLQWLPGQGKEKQVLIEEVVRENWLLR
ncbi:MAG: hypothetical protein AAF591_05535 [Verrucomicrobiota bacterium]